MQGAAATRVDNATRSPKRAKDFIVETFCLFGKFSGMRGEIMSFSQSLVIVL